MQRELEKLRKKIDKADHELLRALAFRFSAVRSIGLLKKANGIPIRQSARWKEVVRDRLKLAKKMGLSGDLADKIFTAIHREAIRTQRKLSSKKSRKRSK